MTIRVSLRGALGFDDVDELCRELGPLRALTVATPVELDFRGLEAISPAPLTVSGDGSNLRG